MSLRKQALSSIVWTFSQQFGTQIITFAIGIVLARALVPSDFGTIAMFGVVMSIAATMVDGGLASSLIRTKDADDSDFSTVFWFNTIIGILMYILIFVTAPLISDFYKLPILTPVIRIYSLTLITRSLTSVQATRFVKEMDFKTSFQIQLPSLLIGGTIGVLLALNGFGIWSLVYYPLVQSIIASAQYWMYSDWKPSLVFDKKKFWFHFKFGYKMTLSMLLDSIFRNIYTVIIGKIFSPMELGYYNRADNLKQLPVANLSAALNKVTFPLFAQLKNDDKKLKEVYKKLMKVVIFVISPLLCLSIVIALPLVRLLLTEKWLPIVPYFQILAIAGILYPIHAYNLNILMVKGRSDLFLKLEIIKKAVIVIVLIITIPYGMIGIVWGQVFISVIAFFINTYYTGKILKYGSISQLIDLLPVLILSTLVAGLTYIIDYYVFSFTLDFLRLIYSSLIYLLAFFGISWLFRFEEINYIKDLLKK